MTSNLSGPKKESAKLLKNFIYVFDIQKKYIFVSQMIH